MAYLRWICSNWYAFWTSLSGETKEDQILEVWHAVSLKPILLYYNALKKVKSVEDLKEIIKKQINIDISDEDYKELLEEAVRPFMEDVEKEFKNEN